MTRHRPSRSFLAAAFGLVLLLTLAPTWATATTLTWIGAVDNNWGTAGNWDLNQAPATGDDLVLTLSGSFRPENNNLVGVQLHSVTLSAAPNPLGFYLIIGLPISLQTGGSITSHHANGFFDRVSVGVTLNGPATFTLAGTQLLLFNGPVTGTGGLTLVNDSGLDGQLQMRAASSYTGPTTVGGTARVVADVAGAIPTTSPVTIVGGGITFNADSTIGSLAGTGVVAADGPLARTLTVGSDNTSTTYAGVLQNGPVTLGLTKIGSGTLTLSGASTNTGATTVSAGTLRLTGSLAGSAVSVANGATLGGTGTAGGNVTAQLGGRLAPGTSIGTFTVGGNVTWHGAATFVPTALFELSNADATSDRLAIGGALIKGSGPKFVFDFQGTGNEAVYTLATFASTTFSAADFSYVNLAPGLVGTFAIVGGTTLQLIVSPPPPSTHDFNGDLKADILWRDTTSGLVAVWLMDGVNILASPTITTLATTWTAAGVGDFDGDGDADILWRENDGDVAVWLLNGTTIATNGPIFPVGTAWTVGGLGDFNGDGNTDIVWRNTSTGQVAIWLMNGTTPIATAVIGTVAPALEIAGVGDFDGDGLADILWRNTGTGEVEIWLVNGTTVTTVVPLAIVATSWIIAGVGDFNGDGVADILWRETTTGRVAIWLMNGATPGTTSLASAAVIATVPTTWTIALTLDFNADGRSDILWRNDDGTVAIWLMNGTSIVAIATVSNVPLNWVPR